MTKESQIQTNPLDPQFFLERSISIVDNVVSTTEKPSEDKVDVFAVGLLTDVHYCLQPQVHGNHRYCPDNRLHQSQKEIGFADR